VSAAAADVAGLVGRVLLVAGPVLLVVAALTVVPPLVRVRRRAMLVRARVEAARRETQVAVALLEAQRGETDELLRPWRTLLRWARHPLVVATFAWYRRRSAARRAHG